MLSPPVQLYLYMCIPCFTLLGTGLYLTWDTPTYFTVLCTLPCFALLGTGLAQYGHSHGDAL